MIGCLLRFLYLSSFPPPELLQVGEDIFVVLLGKRYVAVHHDGVGDAVERPMEVGVAETILAKVKNI